ncbi:MAG: DciA family protein [Pseudomonadota bacterium]|nr:DciA family protein [Pseudomonadota bacterium]
MSSAQSARPPSAPQLALDAMLTGDNARILRHAMWLDAANRAWRAQLPADLRGHLRLGNFNRDDGSLSALADSPAWAERARLATDLLINAARASGLPARRIRVRVARHAPPPLHVAEKPPTAASVTAVKNIMAMLQQE